MKVSSNSITLCDDHQQQRQYVLQLTKLWNYIYGLFLFVSSYIYGYVLNILLKVMNRVLKHNPMVASLGMLAKSAIL